MCPASMRKKQLWELQSHRHLNFAAFSNQESHGHAKGVPNISSISTGVVDTHSSMPLKTKVFVSVLVWKIAKFGSVGVYNEQKLCKPNLAILDWCVFGTILKLMERFLHSEKMKYLLYSVGCRLSKGWRKRDKNHLTEVQCGIGYALIN